MTIKSNPFRRWCYGGWLVLIAVFAVLHAVHLSADFPNHSEWIFDWAKYTDEGWWANAAIRAHLFGNWYLAGDFNPAVALPVLPFLEWLLFFLTGVTLEAARGLAIAFFIANLLLSYLLLRARGPRWAGLLAVTLMATSPFLYCFSRLAILEPLLTAFTLGAMNLAVRLPRMRRPVSASIWIGMLFTLMMLTKTTAIFLLPALGWAFLLPLRHRRRLALRCAPAALGVSALTYGLWMGVVARLGLLGDYTYLFTVNTYLKPKELCWPLYSVWWSFHGGLWVDHILFPLAALLVSGAALAWWSDWGRGLWLDPAFGASVWAAAGYILFMACQNNIQPRYFMVVAYFCFIVVARGVEALLSQTDTEPLTGLPTGRIAGWVAIGLAALAAGAGGARTVNYTLHPEYTFVNAAEQLTHYIDTHPNGKRLLLSTSGDQITLVSHLPTLCDDFVSPTPSIPDLPAKLAAYQPGWYAAWNPPDPDSLEALHIYYSLEQVASFDAFDDPARNWLVLFKLHPLPGGRVRDPDAQNLKILLPDDKFDDREE